MCGIFAELLRYFPLKVDLFGNRVFVEAVFQTARVSIRSFGVDAGVDMCFGFFGSPAGSGKLSRFVGTLRTSEGGIPAASDNGFAGRTADMGVTVDCFCLIAVVAC